MASCTGTLHCGGELHRITWCRGGVVIEDHDEPAGELALSVLGAPWIPCIAVFALVRSGFDPVGTWPVWAGPLPRAGGPELMLRAWSNLVAARAGAGQGAAAGGDVAPLEGAEDRWAMSVLGLVDPPLRRRLALDAVVSRCRRTDAEPVNSFGSGTSTRGFNRSDGRGVLAESIMMSSIGAPPGATLLWLLAEAGDVRSDGLQRRIADTADAGSVSRPG